MTETEKAARIDELTKIINYALLLGVRAEICADREQFDAARKMWQDAKIELEALKGGEAC